MNEIKNKTRMSKSFNIYKGEKKMEEEAEEGESENANNNNKIENIKKQRMGVESMFRVVLKKKKETRPSN